MINIIINFILNNYFLCRDAGYDENTSNGGCYRPVNLASLVHRRTYCALKLPSSHTYEYLRKHTHFTYTYKHMRT